jgi:hypothetical protein
MQADKTWLRLVLRVLRSAAGVSTLQVCKGEVIGVGGVNLVTLAGSCHQSRDSILRVCEPT